MFARSDLELCKKTLSAFSQLVQCGLVAQMAPEPFHGSADEYVKKFWRGMEHQTDALTLASLVTKAKQVDSKALACWSHVAMQLEALTQQFNGITDQSSAAEWEKAATTLQNFICNFRGPSDQTALYYLEYFSLESIKLLVDAGLDPNLRSQKHANGCLPLEYAIRTWCEPEIIQTLIDKGANPANEGAICAAIKSKKTCAAHDAKLQRAETSYSNSLKILQMLLKSKPNLNFSQKYLVETPLMLAIVEGNLDALRLLLKEDNVDPSFQNASLLTALSAATSLYSQGKIEIDFIKELLERGADPYQQARYTNQYSQVRLYSGFEFVTEVAFPVPGRREPLLELFKQYAKNKINALTYWSAHKERINKLDAAGFTPLHYAVFTLDKEAVAALLELGAHQKLQDYRATALFFAIKGWGKIDGIPMRDNDPLRLEIAQLLIDKFGSDILTDRVIRVAGLYKDQSMLALFQRYKPVEEKTAGSCFAGFFKGFHRHSKQVAPSATPLEATAIP